jgi:hypothetical protein
MHIERIPAECAIQPPQKPAQAIVDLNVSRRIIQTADTVCRDAAFMCSGEIADVRARLRKGCRAAPPGAKHKHIHPELRRDAASIIAAATT